MSVIFTTLSNDFIALCADKQATNSITEEVMLTNATKIELWTPSLAIGLCGNYTLGEIVSTCVREYLSSQNGIENYSLEEIADWFAQSYYSAYEEYSEMPRETRADFIVAGMQSNGVFAVYEILVGNGVADTEKYEPADSPITIIRAPEDMSVDECNLLFNQAVKFSFSKKKHYYSPLETAHRKAVQLVSKQSKWVGHKSDFIIIERPYK